MPQLQAQDEAISQDHLDRILDEIYDDGGPHQEVAQGAVDLLTGVDDLDPEVLRRRVDDLRTEINRGMKAIYALHHRRARELQPIDEEIDRLMELRARYAEPVDHALTGEIDRVERLAILHRELEAELVKKPQATLRTPWGEVATTSSVKWEWGDGDVLIAALYDGGLTDLIRVIEEPDKSAIKKSPLVQVTPDGKVVTDKGEVLPVTVRAELSARVKSAGPKSR